MDEVFSELVGKLAFALPTVFGLVEFFKSVLKMEGKAVTLMSFGVGILSSGVVFLSFLFPDWGPYVSGGFFILSSGLVASGCYKFVNARWPRAE